MSDDGDGTPREEDTSFAAELGRTFGGFAFIAVFFAIAGGILWLLLR
ncbi:MAG TPA: hypothetical protein VG889_01935 [Rhizomicrobium sp.]|nr:hypothetical protein [Rhizomicrobium sp.]